MLKKMLTIIAAVLLLQIVVGLDDGKYTVQYNDDTFASGVSEKNHFIMFYAPWCRYYKEFIPIWEAFAKQLNETGDSRVRVGQVDCTTDKSVCRQYSVKFSPTLLLLKTDDNTTVQFEDDREISLLTAFINEQLGNFSTVNVQAPKTDKQQDPTLNLTTDD